MSWRHWLLAWLAACASALSWAQAPIACAPQERGDLTLVPIRPDFFTVSGRLGGFDPCEPHTKFRIPSGAGKPPLMISVHGGGGINDVLKSDEAFFRQGMATLVFDAYAMQGLTGRSSLFWARSVTNEARQRMIYTTALAAYRWAAQRTDVDVQRIYLFGVSNGAAVVANLAGAVDPAHVKGVIAEGVTPIGLGLPDTVRVPVQLVFGKLDNFGNRDVKGHRWALSDDCRLNIQFAPVPAGSSAYCNQSTPGRSIPTALEWVSAVQKRGGQIEVVYIEDMAHNAYFGPLLRQTATWGSGQTLGASLGATDAARAEFFSAMVNFIERYK